MDVKLLSGSNCNGISLSPTLSLLRILCLSGTLPPALCCGGRGGEKSKEERMVPT